MADKTEIELCTVEELSHRLKVAPAVCAGVMAGQGWAAGKQVGAKEFSAAVDKFLSAPVRGGGK